ncbi:MAG: proteasome assembly chaperone family protein [Candidatus Sigynarchaeota archaeon]
MTVTVELFENVNLEGKYLVTGFHGIGVVGYIACKYMIEQTNARRIGTIVSTLMPPLITLDDKGEVLLPFELYLDNKDNIVFLVVRFQPAGEEMRDFTKELVNFIISNKMKGLVLLGGLDYNFKPQDDEKGYRCVVTNGFPVKDKPPLIDAGLFISGGIAMLLIELQLRKVPALTLFPYADRERPDMKAAAKAIEIINETFGTSIKTDKLQEEAKDLEQEVNQILKQQVKEATSRDMYM